MDILNQGSASKVGIGLKNIFDTRLLTRGPSVADPSYINNSVNVLKPNS